MIPIPLNFPQKLLPSLPRPSLDQQKISNLSPGTFPTKITSKASVSNVATFILVIQWQKKNRISALARLAQTSNTFSTNTKANYEHYYGIWAYLCRLTTMVHKRRSWYRFHQVSSHVAPMRFNIRVKWYKKQTCFTVQLEQTSQTLFHLALACALRQRYKFTLPINKKQHQVKCENELLFNTNISTIWENVVSALLGNLFQIWPQL